MTGTEYLRAIQANQNGCEASAQSSRATTVPKLPDAVEITGGHIQPSGLTYGMAQLAVFISTIALGLAKLGEMPESSRDSLPMAGDRLMTVLE